MMGSVHDYLAAEEIDAVRRPLAKASLLSPRCYGDPKFFEFEKEKVFMTSWLPVGRVDEVSEPGEYITKTVFDEPILITRDEAGELHALSNVCRHRAREVAEGSGRCESGVFQCPYHAWKYGLDGQLKNAPWMDKTSDFVPSKVRLPKLRLETWQGFLWINFDANAKPLGEKLGRLDEVLAGYDVENMKTVDFVDYEGRWDWKATIDNFSEAYHQPKIHRETFEPWCPAALAEYEDVDGPYNLFWMPTGNGERFPTTMPPIEGLPDINYKSTFVINVFPYFHLLVDSSSLVWLDWDVKSADRHQLVWKVLLPPKTLELPDFEERKAALLKEIRPVWHEDEYACIPVNTGQKSRFAEPGRMSYMEKSLHQFHQWLMDKYET